MHSLLNSCSALNLHSKLLDFFWSKLSLFQDIDDIFIHISHANIYSPAESFPFDVEYFYNTLTFDFPQLLKVLV